MEAREEIDETHIGRRVKILNPKNGQPVEGEITGFTSTRYVRVKEQGFETIRRLPRNLRLIPEEADTEAEQERIEQ